ncbi:MAG: efflux RND transporter periplasmic adaptor subunit [Bacteroidia bacterium]|nr:efflux RND transporter periplasmic adaptor subunit [Sphingobacteriaceae bacterium]MBK7818505.1 efflux RND transporter periplasmic adaptor subunit [Sphingobacteriaceae bacterium]MBP9069743.1 efflux RND transporter periplasmic adaptor subunit [Bacteroidia bacterium]
MKNYIILITILTFLSSCGNKKETEDSLKSNLEVNLVELTPEQIKNAGIAIGRSEQRVLSSLLKVNGVIDVPPQNMVSISVPLGGYLRSTKLLPGMHVNKGEVIAVMEDQQFIQLQQEYLTAKAKSVFIGNEYDRQKELNQSKATSDKVFQQIESDYKSQRILIRSLSEKLKLIGIDPEGLNENTLSRSINIYAPLDGYVSKVNVNIGKYVTPTDVLFDIVNPTDIHLALTVFEKDVNKLFNGQKVITYTNNNPNEKHNAEIILIGKDLSLERSVVVHCHFEQYDKTLLPGMYMNAEIELKSANANILPEDAVVSFENKQFIFIAKGNNMFEMLEVKTGNDENGYIEILGSDISSKNVVIKGAYSILMKMKNTEEEG